MWRSWIVTCMLIFGIGFAAKAQTDSVSGVQNLECRFVDEFTFKCNLEERASEPEKEGKRDEDARREDPSQNEDDIFNPGDEGTIEEDAEGSEEEFYDRPGVINDDLYLEDEVELDEGYRPDDEKVTP